MARKNRDRAGTAPATTATADTEKTPDVPGQEIMTDENGSPIAPAGGGEGVTAAQIETAARKKRDLGRVLIQSRRKIAAIEGAEPNEGFVDASGVDLNLKTDELVPEFTSADDAVSFIRARGLAGVFRVVQVKRTFRTAPKVDVSVEDIV